MQSDIRALHAHMQEKDEIAGKEMNTLLLLTPYHSLEGVRGSWRVSTRLTCMRLSTALESRLKSERAKSKKLKIGKFVYLHQRKS